MTFTVLTIGGSDPSGGAGIEADLRVLAQLGIHGRTAITALTVQSYLPFARGGHCEAMGGAGDGTAPFDSSLPRRKIFPISPAILSDILYIHALDPPPNVIKIGMIATAENLDVIAEFLQHHPTIPVVLDTVLRATSGLELLTPGATPRLRDELLPLATIVTPNLQEAAVLADMPVSDITNMEQAAKKLQRGSQTVLVKGGHLPGNPVDVAFDGREFYHFHSPRITVSHTRGTGCTLATAIAARLAWGEDPLAAIQGARCYLNDYLKTRF